MRKTINVFLILFTTLFFVSNALSADQQKSLQKLLQASSSPVDYQYSNETGTPQYIKGEFGFPTALSKAEAVKQFLQSHQQFLRYSPGSEFEVKKQIRFSLEGKTIIRMKQSVKGVPIFGSDVSFVVNDMNVLKRMGGFIYSYQKSTIPSISEARAIQIVKKHLSLRESRQAVQSELNIFFYKDQGHLVWKVVIPTKRPVAEWFYFVDAQTGDIVFRFNNVKDALNRRTYTANNGTSLPGTLVITEGQTSSDPIVQNAHDNMGITYNYYSSTFGRDGFNNAGATITTTVHYDNNYVNAYWNGSQFVFGDGDGSQSDPLGNALDVVAHEYTHAVTQYTADLVYSNQPGALNESMSDVFAVMVDRDDWWLGEEVWTPGTPNDALRYMDDPTLGNQPAHMDDYQDVSYDNGGVHINSGIPNKAAYNIATTIGRAKTEQIYYRALTTYITSNSSFYQARLALVDAATDLYGAGSAEVQAVNDGFDAVGIVDDSGGGGCSGAMQILDAPIARIDAKLQQTMNEGLYSSFRRILDNNKAEIRQIIQDHNGLLTEFNSFIIQNLDFFEELDNPNTTVNEQQIEEAVNLATKLQNAGSETLKADLEKIIVRLKTLTGKNLANVAEIKDLDDSNTPKRFEFISNYPNPFNPSTTFRIHVVQKGKVSLKVFDIQGREVAKVIDGILEAGNYNIEFNASKLPSGLYFYRFTSPVSSITKKMVLIK